MQFLSLPRRRKGTERVSVCFVFSANFARKASFVTNFFAFVHQADEIGLIGEAD